jgi:cellulose synthase (UDP-forming)
MVSDVLFSGVEVYTTIITFPIAFVVINTCINPFGKGFKVTPKAISANKAILNWQAASPLVIFFLLYLVSIGTHFLN